MFALCNYYHQAINKKRNTLADESARDATPNRGVARDDKWALEWINVNRLQAITEAFDDDASGFITITEVNSFTASRPKDWRCVFHYKTSCVLYAPYTERVFSLLHWLAYWAIGWQMTATGYRDEITTICAQMFAIRPYLHSSNLTAVNMYLQTLWGKLPLLTSSLTSVDQGDYLEERFRSYVETEEHRLREGLETVKYAIDGMDTLSLITGQGRIEKVRSLS